MTAQSPEPLPTIKINADAPMETIAISAAEKVVIVDDFLVDPHALIDHACAHAGQFFVPEAGYPGPNLILDDTVLRDYHRYLLRRMGSQFGFLRGGAHIATGLSMVTLPPERLGNFQRLCHTDPRDTMGRRKFAAMVYLFDDEQLGGTAFYRWKKPDVIEHALAMEMRDPVATTALLAEHCRDFREPPRYITESNELAEQLAVIPPRFNRLICYSGEVPHTGHITAPEKLSTDFRRGRLTLNCFASVVPG
jgi:hypothetical protein